jgi:sec-independent protein translocase protein TatB
VFNLSGTEIIVILLLALVILGPEKLPEAMRKAGRAYSELRKMANSFQSEVRSALDEPMEELRGTADALRDATNFTGDSKKPTKSPTTPRATTSPATTSAATTPAEPVVEAEPEQAAIDDLFADDGDEGAGSAHEHTEGADSDDLITRTLRGDVAPHEPTDEAGSAGPAGPPGPAA